MNVKSSSNRDIGNRGEDLAAEYLVNNGYQILERNYRWRSAEIDIIALKEGVLIFCEVKRSRFDGDSHPELRVDIPKQKKIAQCAQLYLAGSPPPFHTCRFDIIAITRRDGRDYLEHFPNAFWAPEE